MVTITAKLNILSGNNSALSGSVKSTEYKSNISADFENAVGKKNKVANPFMLGSSTLGSGATFSSGVDYYIGSKLSRDDIQGKEGEILFESEYVFEIEDKTGDLEHLIIAFDTRNKRHPRSIIVDGVEYFDDDAVFVVSGIAPNGTHTLEVNNWNTLKAPLVITGVYADLSIDIDPSNLISIERTIYDRADLKLPSFGIISNTGNVEFNDNNLEVRDLAETRLLKKGLQCEMRLNNSDNGRSDLIGLYETDQWNYDNENFVVSVSLKDDLEEWQEINVEGISYDPREAGTEKNFQWLYEHLWGITSNRSYINENNVIVQGKGNYNMLAYNELDEDTKNILYYTIIKYPLLNAGTLWEQWEKFCAVCLLHIYKDTDGIIKCKYNGGN